jgi:CBS domain-containing protein
MGDSSPPRSDGADEVARILGSSPPFDALPPERLGEIAAATHQERLAPGTTILASGGPPADALYLIGSGYVQIWTEGRVVDQPGPGEVFGELSLLSGATPTATVVAGDDLVCLEVDGDVARKVLGTAGGVTFVQASLRRGVLQSLDRETRSLAGTIEGAADDRSAIAAVRELPERTCQLVDDGADAMQVGRVIGSSIDALTRRLLASALEETGEPPAAWAWMALGSEARLEQALHTDQDHALAYDPGDRSGDDVDPYFAELAERVTAGLESAGIPRCTGDAMAITPALRRSLESWKEAFRGWMSDVAPEGSLFSSVAFDHRRLAGQLDIGPAFQSVISTAGTRYPGFLQHLGRRALGHKPPTGFVKDFVVEHKGEHAGRLDVKHGGITIITSIARYYAITAGRSETSTLDRLRAAQAAGELDAESVQAMEEAFRLLWQIRLEHQVRQVRAGEQPDDFVDPSRLGPIQRLGLKEAFRIIGKEQQGVAVRIGARY